MRYLLILFLLLISGCAVKKAHYAIDDPVWIKEKNIVRIDTVTVKGNKFKIVKYRESIFK